MPDVVTASIDDLPSIARAAETFADRLPDYSFEARPIAAELALESDGVAYHWVASGQGEVHLPEGHRTQEGDGQMPLPADYRLVPPDSDVPASLAVLTSRLEEVAPSARPVVADLLARSADGRVGEISSDLTRIRQTAGDVADWATGDARLALGQLLAHAETIGVYERAKAGWEPVETGDVLVTTPDRPLRVRGELRLWRIEDRARTDFPLAGQIRRQRHLRDTAGGCGPGEEAFRRLSLPWRLPPDGSPLEGDNRLNSHLVNIVASLSRTHIHPDPPVNGGSPQWELYLVHDPRSVGLGATTRSVLHTFPDVSDWSRWKATDLRPGDAVVIPPNTGHRGIDVLVSVVAIPGFKPGNEIYVDRDIAVRTGGASPHNAAFAGKDSPAGVEGVIGP